MKPITTPKDYSLLPKDVEEKERKPSCFLPSKTLCKKTSWGLFLRRIPETITRQGKHSVSSFLEQRLWIENSGSIPKGCHIFLYHILKLIVLESENKYYLSKLPFESQYFIRDHNHMIIESIMEKEDNEG